MHFSDRLKSQKVRYKSEENVVVDFTNRWALEREVICISWKKQCLTTKVKFRTQPSSGKWGGGGLIGVGVL